MFSACLGNVWDTADGGQETGEAVETLPAEVDTRPTDAPVPAATLEPDETVVPAVTATAEPAATAEPTAAATPEATAAPEPAQTEGTTQNTENETSMMTDF